MANIIRGVLTTDQMTLTLPCAGMSKAGFGISGTWTGTVTFKGSFDGVNFQNISVTPFPSGTAVQSTTANGNFEFLVKNFAAVQILFSLTTGSLTGILGASLDASYQDAFLASTSTFVEQDAAAGAANTITIAAQANRAWRCRTLVGGFSAAPAAAVKVTISDGASAVIWAQYLAASAGPWTITLPADPNVVGASGGGVVNTPGNSLVITIAAPGGTVATSTSAEILPA